MQEIEVHGPIKDKAAIRNAIRDILGQDAQVTPVTQTAVFFKHQDANLVIRWNKKEPNFEFIYKCKLIKGGGLSVREEITTRIPKPQAENFLKILSRLGLDKGLVSPATRFEFTKDQVEWSFKLNTQIGNYWEAEATPSLIEAFHNNSDLVLDQLRETATNYQLDLWTEAEFSQHYKQAWEGVEPKPMGEVIRLLKATD